MTNVNTGKFIAESVTYMHPDKICDQISDLILDECLKQDPYSRVAIEVAGGHDKLAIFGEITSKAVVNVVQVVKDYYKELSGKDIDIKGNIVSQSDEIARGVDLGGAGDQGIMVGYACSDNNNQYVPDEIYIARQLLKKFNVDGKAQVVIDNGKVESVVISVQGETVAGLLAHVCEILPDLKPSHIFANNAGTFEVGGFSADSGVTGRKIVVDAYGPRVPVGGGAFSGKDATKVDRSAAYMARFIALETLKKYGANDVLVKLGYAIGKVEPVVQSILVDGIINCPCEYDCRPQAIIDRFDLRKPIYLDTARNGHFGRIGELPWEKI